MNKNLKNTPNFQLDERLQSSSFQLIDWPLSRVLLKNNAFYPWLILVPRRIQISEITELSALDMSQLMEELQKLSLIVQDLFKPDKINIATLGNIVPQLHIHVVARFKNDLLWPEGVWQSALQEKPYEDPQALIAKLKEKL